MSLGADLAAFAGAAALGYVALEGGARRGAEAPHGGRRRRKRSVLAHGGFAGPGYGLEFRRAPAGVELGRASRFPVRLYPRDSVVVFGPTQSFKTSALVAPAIRAFPGAVVATSVKEDILPAARSGRLPESVLVFDPYGVGESGNCHWNPLLPGMSDAEARHLAAVICQRPASGLEDSEFWTALAAKLLHPLLWAAAALGAYLGTVREWVEARDFRTPSEALLAGSNEDAMSALASSLDREERQLSSVLTTLERLLEPFVAGTAPGGNLNARQFSGDAGTALCLLAPPNRQAEAGPLFGAVLRLLLDDAFASPPRRGMLLALDEAANCAPIPNLDEIISVIAAYGVQAITVFHDYAQARARYGERASTLVNNHRAKLFLSGISDPETLALAETLCGSTGGLGGDEALMPRGGLRSLAPGRGLLIYGHRRPVLVRLNRRQDSSGRFSLRALLPIPRS
ncbi:MAG: type IV secretory system conjugative DNA transfer family protein [Actinomycetota bacterium]|nr:type IV secretory system conjugative DNA transfer family protein [Actinomycetota bacterium]